ncbi:hypothetical protein MRX96_033281 [Rhipicephalus microplus]
MRAKLARPTPKASANTEPYCEKYYSLLKRYNAIQKQNYHLMYRIQRVKKLTTRLTKEKRFLTQRLNNYKQGKTSSHVHDSVRYGRPAVPENQARAHGSTGTSCGQRIPVPETKGKGDQEEEYFKKLYSLRIKT